MRKSTNEREYKWRIKENREETRDARTLVLSAASIRPSFKAGQYLTVKLPELDTVEGKAYSISSSPHEDDVCITIRRRGNFSEKLLSLTIGDHVITSSPYGFFFPEPSVAEDIVFLAGGIGISPCISIIEHLMHTKSPRSMHLHYSSQTADRIVFKDRLTELSKDNQNLSIVYYLTRDTNTNLLYQNGRMEPSDILSKLPKPAVSEFFLCGGISFTRDMRRGLIAGGVQQEKIYTEAFF